MEDKKYTMHDIGTYDEQDGKYFCRYIVTAEHLETLRALELSDAMPTGSGLDRFRLMPEEPDF